MMASALFLLLIGLADYGGAAWVAIQLRDAARAGAQYALRNPSSTTNIASVAKAATRLTSDSLTVTSSDFCLCDNGSSVSCTGTCESGVPSEFVKVTVSRSYSSLITYPGISNPSTLSATATLRYK